MTRQSLCRLISPESGLHFAKVLCGKIPIFKEAAQKVLNATTFRIVVNANPVSRKAVEAGDFCLRGNEHHVDLNRNWNDHWVNTSSYGPETNPGQRPFSEPETVILKKLVESFSPHVFLTVHSGAEGMFTPWAYTFKTPVGSRVGRMVQILK